MSERLANLGYLGLIKEVTAGTPLTPTDFIPLYDESITTNLNLVDQTPIYGGKFATYATIQGLRSHKGDLTVLAEPNTTAKLMDMLLTKTSTSGANPYTHVFSLTGDSNSYTIDVSTGNVVKRFFGVKASKISPSWNGTELQWKVSVSALGSFQGRALNAAPTGSGTYTCVLSTAYDPAPTTGLVAGDLIRFYKAPSTTIDAVVLAVTDGTTFTTSTNVTTMTTGDMVYLRPATVAFTLLPSFIWPKTQFKLGATAAAALSASQVRVEQGSSFELLHNFEKDTGATRSGGFDPAALIRTTGDVSLKIKRFFDTPDDIANMNALTKTAAVISHLAGATNQYECRVTINNLKTDGAVAPNIASDEIVYSEIEYHTNYDSSDSKGFEVTVINALSTI